MNGARTRGTVDKLIATAKRNPEGVLLLAAGAALLVRGINAASNAIGESSRTGRDGNNQNRRGAISHAQRYAHDVADTVGDSIGRAASYAEEIGSTAFETSGRFVDDAGRTIKGGMTRVLEEQPLAMALLGLAAGAVAAGSIPSLQIEGEALRPVKRTLVRTAEQTQGRLKKAAKKATRRLEDVVEERGLNAQGLGEAARDVTDAFTDELTGGTSGSAAQEGSGGSAAKTAKPAAGEDPDTANVGSKQSGNGSNDRSSGRES
jgi:hypothetical protein